ncbi:MAG: glycosyltransferase [Acidobacteria bacterium]|nr:glycosyltransferase [Acidobacteriota bacterium]
MKRIVLVGPGPATRGGIAQFNSHLATALAPRAWVSVICFRRLYPAWTLPGRDEREPSPVRLPVPVEPTLVAWRPGTWRAAARRLEEIRPDAVVLQWWHPAFGPCLRSLARGARRAGATVAFVAHNVEPHERLPAARFLTRGAFATADRVLALSETSAEDARRIAAAPVEVLDLPPFLHFRRSPATRALWRDRIGDGAPIILFFGCVRPYKGLGDAVRAMPTVRRHVPGAILVVAGRFYEPVARYRALAARLGLDGGVRLFPGYVPNDEVGGLLSAADVIVLPYRSASQSGVLPQALAFGRPVVATRVGGIPEALAGRGLLVPPSAPEALAEGLIRALDGGAQPPSVCPDGWDAWRDAILRLP